MLFIAFEPGAVRPGFDRARARALLRFGLPLAGSSIVVFAATNVDRLIVGALLGPVPLGLYVLAFNLSSWPATIFSLPVRAVAPALLARLQADRRAMRAAFLSATRLLAAVTLPACVLLATTAAPLVRFVYGEVWAPAAGVLVWLALLGALRILFELVYDYFVVLANTRVVFTIQLVWLLALIPAIWFGTSAAGVAGAGLAQFAVGLLVVLPIYLRELHRPGSAPPPSARRCCCPSPERQRWRRPPPWRCAPSTATSQSSRSPGSPGSPPSPGWGTGCAPPWPPCVTSKHPDEWRDRVGYR